MVKNKVSLKVSILLLEAAILLGCGFEGSAWARGERQGPPGGVRGGDFFYTPHYVPHGREFIDIPGEYMRLIIGGLEYYYWEGMFYRFNGRRYIVVQPPVGAVVTAIPQGSQPVIVDGVAYYNINGVTYMWTSAGYQVVPQPKTIIIKNYNNVTEPVRTVTPVDNSAATNQTADQAQAKTAAEQSDEVFTVNVPNSKGGYTAVTLKRSGEGFTGPQGEYYTEFPKIEQLKVMYAK